MFTSTPIVQILAGTLAMSVLMLGVWLWQRRSGNAGWVDVFWALGIGLLVGWYVLSSAPWQARHGIVLAIAGLWSLRLAGTLAWRSWGAPEDGRYQSLRKGWGERAQTYLFGFFQLQASWAVLFSLPALLALQNRTPLHPWWTAAALAVFALSLVGEGVADAQLARWRAVPENRGKTCRQGLWRVSRHPNYFFEWLHWFCYPLLAIGSAWWWLGLAAPAVMLLFLYRLTGIPYTEAQALKSRGDDYRAYQQETSAFFPWFPRDTGPLAWLIAAIERGWLPDTLIRWGIRRLNSQRLVSLQRGAATPKEALVEEPIAVRTEAANEQHYALPAALFRAVLGKHLKYSCCWWDASTPDLDAAEQAMLDLYCERAQLEDGQRVLDLGCGWGSLSLFIAARYPNSRVLGVSNRALQKASIEADATARGLSNIEIRTCDASVFEPAARFDRIVSIEMLEHIRNHQRLLQRVAGWLEPDGLMFTHIFCHARHTYLFAEEGADNWMGRHFFSGGMMPARDLFLQLDTGLESVASWQVDGRHYQRTSEAWLQNLDAQRTELRGLFEQVYGKDAGIWFQRWRIFFMACAELFGAHQGSEWFVVHHLFRPKAQAADDPISQPQTVELVR